MDANEAEADVQLYKHSRDLIKDLDHELTTQLRKPDNRGGTKIRPWVRTREMMKSICSVSPCTIATFTPITRSLAILTHISLLC